MGMLVLIVCFHDRLCLCIFGKVPRDGLVMIDPNNRVIVGHSASLVIVDSYGLRDCNGQLRNRCVFVALQVDPVDYNLSVGALERRIPYGACPILHGN